MNGDTKKPSARGGWLNKQLVCVMGSENKSGIGLFYIKSKHADIFEEALKFVSYYRFTNPGRRTGKDHVPDVYRKEVGNIGYQVVKIVDHV